MGKFKRRRYVVALLCDGSICEEFNAEVKKLLSEGGHRKLCPLIIKRDCTSQRWLKSQLPRDREHFVSQCRHVARMVREAKKDWYQQQAQFVEKGVTGGSMHVVSQNIWRGQAGIKSA